MQFSQVEEEEPELSIAPLIDCVFLLLIFFLVTTMLKKDDKSVEHIELPSSASALEVPPDDSMFVIALDADGEIYYEGEPTTIQLLHYRLRAIEQTDPERRIRLDTDGETPFNRVAEVLDICAFRNLRNVGVRTFHEKYD
ncbi:biopolymer transporter ExbD [Rubellicoccus peritrichatus]|uniref:Biopolymer transporter ExbD n=1 Tax=Rubellicoccus peritrichatus TaxID=3080537 RepID=A0AAQ3L5Q3_9BACT|nr:biopolymer transporter ExbD [Puniceicoccus sp. CR14]WOO39366.1 biopolymer transporter ExbD [Puniceicoccus sp. CR14]